MTKFRACIDLHNGKVKQIVGSTLSQESIQTNFISKYNSTYYANLYKKHNLKGSHLIQLGPNNEEQAKMAIAAYKDLQVGGGINLKNCQEWIKAGAKQIIVTSCLFKDYKFQFDYLLELNSLVGKEAIVIDLSCKRVGNQWIVAMDKWQKLTDLVLSQSLFDLLSDYCSEFLVHASSIDRAPNDTISFNENFCL
jgi:phosphoribosylformimino-5-aminoimidazole carboxamide ribotide isomerase